MWLWVDPGMEGGSEIHCLRFLGLAAGDFWGVSGDRGMEGNRFVFSRSRLWISYEISSSNFVINVSVLLHKIFKFGNQHFYKVLVSIATTCFVSVLAKRSCGDARGKHNTSARQVFRGLRSVYFEVEVSNTPIIAPKAHFRSGFAFGHHLKRPKFPHLDVDNFTWFWWFWDAYTHNSNCKTSYSTTFNSYVNKTWTIQRKQKWNYKKHLYHLIQFFCWGWKGKQRHKVDRAERQFHFQLRIHTESLICPSVSKSISGLHYCNIINTEWSSSVPLFRYPKLHWSSIFHSAVEFTIVTHNWPCKGFLSQNSWLHGVPEALKDTFPCFSSVLTILFWVKRGTRITAASYVVTEEKHSCDRCTGSWLISRRIKTSTNRTLLVEHCNRTDSRH